VFDANTEDKLPTDDILAALNKMDESPWATIRRGEAMDSRSLSNRLGKYGIGSKPQRDGERVFKGYSRGQFEDAWKRYVPVESDPPTGLGDSSVTSVTDATSQVNGSDPVTDVQTLSVTRLHESVADDSLTSGNTAVTAVTAKNGRPALCPNCSRAPARSDTGLCDFCTARKQAVDAAQARLGTGS
jgi:Protein of unknown function (DUF3631)